MRQRVLFAVTGMTAFALASCSWGSTATPDVRHTLPPSASPSGSPSPSPTPTASVTPTPTPTASVTPTPTPTASVTPTPTAQPQVVHVGFTHTATTDPTYGPIAFYAPNGGSAAIITVKAGSQLVFTNDGGGPPHTASGLGSSGFPGHFDNTNGAVAFGSTVDGGTTWSSGNLNSGQTSSVFTVGPAGSYYFGCAYHYDTNGMRDVIVSQ